MANINTINTRIALKIDTLSNWNTSTFIPLAGEVCIAKVDTVEGSTLQPTMIKVGDGTKTFANLDWTSAKAADVYNWAKAKSVELNNQKLQFTDASGAVLKEVDLSDFVTADELAAAIGEVVNTITTVSAGNGINVKDNGTNGNYAYTVSHADTSSVTNLAAAARTYVTGLTFDEFGHVTAIETDVEEDQDLSNYKTKQSAVAETGATDKTLKIAQNENGEITVKAETIAIAQSQVAGLEDRLTDTEGVASAAAPQATTYTKIEVDTKIDDAVKSLLGEDVDEAYNTFKELQDILDGKEGAQGLIDEVAANKEAIEDLKDGTIKAKTASSLDEEGIAQVQNIKVNNATNADTAYDLSAELDAEIADVAKAAVEALDVEDTAVSGEYVSAVSETDGKISVTRTALPTYHEIATTGSIYDVTEGSNVSTGADDAGVEYLIFNCGTAKTII